MSTSIERFLDLEAHEIRSMDRPDGQPIVAFMVRRRFPLVEGEIVSAEARRCFPGVHGALSGMEALAPVRESTDVCLLGHAYGGDAASVDVVLEVGACKRRIRAHGPRRVRRRGAGHVVDLEGAASRVALTWENAFGGVDEEAADFLERTGMVERITHPVIDLRNPHGTGYRIGGGVARLVDQPLPALDAPDDEVTLERLADFEDFRSLPAPAVLLPFLPYHLGFVERLCTLGVDRVSSFAQDGLCDVVLSGGEPFVLEGVTEGRPRVEGHVPFVCPTTTLRFDGSSPRRLSFALRSLVFLPDLACFDATFTAEVRVASFFPDEALALLLRGADVIWHDGRN